MAARSAEVKSYVLPDVKSGAQAVYACWGMSLSDAINAFLKCCQSFGIRILSAAYCGCRSAAIPVPCLMRLSCGKKLLLVSDKDAAAVLDFGGSIKWWNTMGGEWRGYGEDAARYATPADTGACYGPEAQRERNALAITFELAGVS